jgi:hypothetical protein
MGDALLNEAQERVAVALETPAGFWINVLELVVVVHGQGFRRLDSRIRLRRLIYR